MPPERKKRPDVRRTIKRRPRRVTYSQMQHLYEFLKDHRDIAVGINKGALARESCKHLWQKVATVLNDLDKGSAIKTGIGWAKYWVDLKAKIKKKIRDNQEAAEMGAPSALQLTDVEIKFLSIFEPDYESNYPNLQEITLDPPVASSDDETANNRLHHAKRSCLPQSDEPDQNIKNGILKTKKIEFDEYTAFGIHIANQLRNLSSLELYINAQDEIQTIVTRYRLEDLKKNSDSELINDINADVKDDSPKCYGDDDDDG